MEAGGRVATVGASAAIETTSATTTSATCATSPSQSPSSLSRSASVSASLSASASVSVAASASAAQLSAALSDRDSSYGHEAAAEGDLLSCVLQSGDEEDGRHRPHDRLNLEDAAMAACADAPEQESLRSCVSTASMKVKNIKKLSFPKGHFPRLAECAHFHYENVDFGSIQLSLSEEQCEPAIPGGDPKDLVYLVQISCQGHSWLLRRSYEDFRVLDKHLHLCIYDRRFSQLTELPRTEHLKDKAETVPQMLTAYLTRLSAIADNKINCGPALTWMEIDNKGNHLLVRDESSINVPAIAAAHVVKRYIAQAADELSFEVGDIVSVIDMPPKEDTGWWRGKHGFQVGFFPCDCVELISEKIPASVGPAITKPVSKKHGKLITFLRSFMKSRPSKQKLKQRGIFRERVFGCDLGEYLLNSGTEVPQVIRSATEFIEKHGVVDGIYRLSGIASNIQKLRHDFDSEHIPDLTKDIYIQDIHSVGSLCKLFFRELPNPLLTYQLYEKFSDAVSAATDEERLVKIHDVIQQLPPPHYRTLEFLMRHLARLATFSYITNMHSKNLAIVWAPNLLRSRQIESACFSGTSAFMEVRIQSVVVEFILNHVEVLFSSKLNSLIREGSGHGTLARPKSLLVCSPSTKLLSLEEAQARISPSSPHSKYIEVGEGPSALQGRFHTVIDFPAERKKAPVKSKKSPIGGWRNFFHRGRSSSTASKRKLHRHPSEPNQIKTMALPGGRGDSGTLRSAKSEESLSSHNFEVGDPKLPHPRRPVSISEALSTSFNEELLESQAQSGPAHHKSDPTHQRLGPSTHHHKSASVTSCVPALISPPRHDLNDDAVDSHGRRPLSSDLGHFTDFDPMAFQASGGAVAAAAAVAAPLPGPSSSHAHTHAEVRKQPTEASHNNKSSCRGNAAEVDAKKRVSPVDKMPAAATAAAAATSPIAPEDGQGAVQVKQKKEKKGDDKIEKRVVILTNNEPSSTIATTTPPAAVPEEVQTAPVEPHVIPEPKPEKQAPVAVMDSVSSTPLTSSPSMRSEALPSESAPNRAGSKRSGSCSGDCRAAAMEPKQNRPDPGTLTLDCTPGLVSADSLISPQPPGKNAARMLALALAESAQQVALHTQRGGPLQSPSSPSAKLPMLSPVGPHHDWPPHSPPQATTPTADPKYPLPSHASRSAAVNMADAPPPPRGLGRQSAAEEQLVAPVKLVRVCGACGGEEREPGMRGTSAHVGPRVCQCIPSSAPPQQRPRASSASVSVSVGTSTPSQDLPDRRGRGNPAGVGMVSEQQVYGSPKPLHPAHHHQPKPLPPTPPRRTAESRLATAALQNREAVNASNFRTVLAEASAPSSLKEVFPYPSHGHSSSSYPLSPEEDPYGPPHSRVPRSSRGPAPPAFPAPQPESLPLDLGRHKVGRHHHHPKHGYETHYGTLGPRSLHQSIKYKDAYRDEHSSNTHFRRSGQWYAPLEGALVYPTIRRVRSLHAPPEDRPFFFQNHPPPAPPPPSSYGTRKGPSHHAAEIHQVQPYFENGKVQYRYNPYSDPSYADLEAHRSSRQYSQSHAYTIRRVPVPGHGHGHGPGPAAAPPPLKMRCAPPGCYPNPLSHVMPEKDYTYQSHDACHVPSRKEDPSFNPHVWSSEPPDRHFHQATLRRDGRSRRKPQGLPPGQQPQPQQPYVGVSPVRSKAEGGGGGGGRRESRHVRHRSDSGRDLLISTEEPGGHFKVTMVTQSSPEQLFSEGESSQPEPRGRKCEELGAREALMLKQTGSGSYRNSQHMQEGRPLPPHLSLHKEYSCPDFKHSDGGGGGGGGGSSRVREPDRALYRTLSSRYPDEDYYYSRGGARASAPRHERSQSSKGLMQGQDHRDRKMESDHWGAQHYPPPPHQPQPMGRSHSFLASRYDSMEGYVPVTQPRTPKSGPFPNHGCMPPSNHRLYSTALGQGGFLQGQPRPEAEVYVE